MIAHFWSALGHSDLGLRSLSIAFGSAGLLAAWGLARSLFGARAALLALALLALHPWHVYFSQEARSYPMLWLWLTLSAFGAWRWSERGGRVDAALFVLASALALWTHYLAGIVLLVQWSWGLLRLRHERGRLLAWIGLHAAIALLFAPVLPLWWTQLHRAETDHWMPRPTPADLLEAARKLSFNALYLVPAFLALLLAPFTARSLRRPAGFALAVGPGTLLLCWLLGTAGVRVFAPKYMLFALPAALALVAAGVARLGARWARMGLAVALVLFAWRATTLRAPYPEAGALARARTELVPRVRQGDWVFLADSHTLLFAQRYFPQARHALLLMGQPLPYFEGGHLVADSLRAEADLLRGVESRHERWFALAARPAGLEVNSASALFDSLAGEPSQRFDVVRLWSSNTR